MTNSNIIKACLSLVVIGLLPSMAAHAQQPVRDPDSLSRLGDQASAMQQILVKAQQGTAKIEPLTDGKLTPEDEDEISYLAILAAGRLSSRGSDTSLMANTKAPSVAHPGYNTQASGDETSHASK